jgi:hypothetical protein
MAGAFEIATRSAIREIITNLVQPSKFGFVMSHEALDEIGDQIFDLILTSRNLKSAGDRMIAQGFGVPGAAQGTAPRPRRG